MRMQRTCRNGLFVIVLLCAGFGTEQATAQDQNTTISQAVRAMQTRRAPAPGFAALPAAGVPGFQSQSKQAAKPHVTHAVARAVLTSRGSFSSQFIGYDPAGHDLAPDRAAQDHAPIVAQNLSDPAPEATGSVPKNLPSSAAAAIGVEAAVSPRPDDDTNAEATPAVETPAATSTSPVDSEAAPVEMPTVAPTPAALSPAPDAAPPAPAALAPPPDAATPAAAAPPAAVPLSFADRLHMAVEAWAATDVKGPGAAQIRKMRAAIAAYYNLNNYAPLWLTDGKANDAARAVLARLAHAQDDGLAIDHLPVFAEKANEDDLIVAEINLSDAVVAYGREATGSRIASPETIDKLIGARPAIATPENILSSVAAAGSAAGTVLQDFNPPQEGYRALRDKLAELRSKAAPQVWRTIPAGPTLRVGMRDPRVPLIRSRFGLGVDADGRQLVYDTQVAAAVAEFQKEAGIQPSGTLTARTLAALSERAPSISIEDDLIANMEMWRWLPRDLGADRIEVNIPDFSVAVYRNRQLVARNKVIVGKPDTRTPVFSNAMQYLIVNPVWNIPPSIIHKEFHDSPDALRQHGYEVSYRNGHMVAQQAPGERNALGRIKFIFPNNYAVYLHDTPTRALFSTTKRAYSHGCVRVDQPFDFAKAVLGPDSKWTEDRLKDLIGGGRERYVFLPQQLPIHIEYFTAFVDGEGHLQLRKDLYGYTRKIDVALGLDK